MVGNTCLIRRDLAMMGEMILSVPNVPCRNGEDLCLILSYPSILSRLDLSYQISSDPSCLPAALSTIYNPQYTPDITCSRARPRGIHSAGTQASPWTRVNKHPKPSSIQNTCIFMNKDLRGTNLLFRPLRPGEREKNSRVKPETTVHDRDIPAGSNASRLWEGEK